MLNLSKYITYNFMFFEYVFLCILKFQATLKLSILIDYGATVASFTENKSTSLKATCSLE